MGTSTLKYYGFGFSVKILQMPFTRESIFSVNPAGNAFLSKCVLSLFVFFSKPHYSSNEKTHLARKDQRPSFQFPFMGPMHVHDFLVLSY